MKIFTLSALSGLTVALFLSSCSKHNNPPTSATGTVNINLTDLGGQEIIISESNGKILLDTITSFNSTLTAKLSTDQTLLDLNIIYILGNDQYSILTYRGVNLSNWSSIMEGTYHIASLAGSLPERNASIVYTHVPVSPVNYIFTGSGGPFNFQAQSGAPGTFGGNYTLFGTKAYLYLLFVNSGLYNFHTPAGLADTVDLSHMDTAVMLNFNRPSQYTLSPVGLMGVIDTTDYSSMISLYPANPYPGAPDVEYPKKLVQKMELNATGSNSNAYVYYYSYGDKVPLSLPFPDESSYSISSSQSTNFSVKFPSGTPTYYYTRWSNQHVQWWVYSSGDSTTLNLQNRQASISTKLITAADLSGLALDLFIYESVAGFDYPGFVAYLHNPALLKTKRVSSSVIYSKVF